MWDRADAVDLFITKPNMESHIRVFIGIPARACLWHGRCKDDTASCIRVTGALSYRITRQSELPDLSHVTMPSAPITDSEWRSDEWMHPVLCTLYIVRCLQSR